MRGPTRTRPRRCRHGSSPTDPARQETPSTFGTRSVSNGLAPLHGRLGRCPKSPRRASPVPAAPRNTSPGTSDAGMDSRCDERVAAPIAGQLVTARRRNQARPAHGGRGSRSTLADHQLRSAASARTPTPTAACTIAGWTQPRTHMTSKPVMSPPPPRREHRMGRWECAERSTCPACRARVSPQPSHHRALPRATSSKLGVTASRRRPLPVFSCASTAVGRDDVTTAA